MKDISCEACGFAYKPADKSRLHYHHIRPKKHGGDDIDANKILLCPNCHSIAHIRLSTALLDGTVYEFYSRDYLVISIRNYIIESKAIIDLEIRESVSEKKQEPLRAKLLRRIGSVLLGIKIEDSIEVRIRHRVEFAPESVPEQMSQQIDKILNVRDEIREQILIREREIQADAASKMRITEEQERQEKEIDKKAIQLMKSGLFISIESARQFVKSKMG